MAMARNEKGSLLGVMTAATRKMITIAGRRQCRHLALGTTPTSSRKTTTSGYMKTSPKIRHIEVYRVKYLEGENSGTIPEPLTLMSQVRAFGNTRMAVVTPVAKRTTAAEAKGTTRRF